MVWVLGIRICDVGLGGENGGFRGLGEVEGLAKEWENRAWLVGVIKGCVGLTIGLSVVYLWSVGENWNVGGLG